MFGQPSYDITQEREFVPFEEQLEGMQAVIAAGKVGSSWAGTARIRSQECVAAVASRAHAACSIANPAHRHPMHVTPLAGAVRGRVQ